MLRCFLQLERNVSTLSSAAHSSYQPEYGVRPSMQRTEMPDPAPQSSCGDNMQVALQLAPCMPPLANLGSHIFCNNCAGTTGLSRSSSGNRICPACQTQLINADDVVVTLLNPAEDYKTSVLSGLSPSTIMECATRGLAFYSYQASQEVIYQEHLAKSLKEKYGSLSQSMDQLIHDANAQIKALQEKLQAMHDDQASLEQKNQELVDAYRDKSRAQAQAQKLYQSLKAQVMATQVAHAAGEDVDTALDTIRQGDRFIDKFPGVRSGTANVRQVGAKHQCGGVYSHNPGRSGSSEGGGIQSGSGLRHNPPLQARMLGGRTSAPRTHMLSLYCNQNVQAD